MNRVYYGDWGVRWLFLKQTAFFEISNLRWKTIFEIFFKVCPFRSTLKIDLFRSTWNNDFLKEKMTKLEKVILAFLLKIDFLVHFHILDSSILSFNSLYIECFPKNFDRKRKKAKSITFKELLEFFFSLALRFLYGHREDR